MDHPREEQCGPSSSGPRAREVARSTGILALALALFFLPAITSSDQFLFRDNGILHAPVKRYITEEFSRGHFPQWNPYLGLGTPIVAGVIDAVQHPFNLFLVAFPFEIGFKLWVLLSYLGAAIGMFAWGRASGRSEYASLAAAIAFALSGHLVSSSDNLQYLTTYAALPWVFFAGHRLALRLTPGRLAAVGVASGLCAAGGDPQAWGVSIAALPFYVAASSDRLGSGLRRAVAGVAASLLVAGPFILPLVLWLSESARAEPLPMVMLRRWNMPPLRLLELAVPHVFRAAPGAMESPVFKSFYGDPSSVLPWVLSTYVGAAAVAFAILGAIRSRRAFAFCAAAGLFAWMSLGHHAGFSQLAEHIPVLGGFRYWEKMVIGVTLPLCVAASHGIDALVTRTSDRVFAAALAAVGVSMLSASVGLWGVGGQGEGVRELLENLRDGLVHAGVVMLLVAVLASGALKERRLRSRLLVVVVAGDLMAANARAYVILPVPPVAETSALARYLATRPGLQRVLSPFSQSEVGEPSSGSMTPAERALRWTAGTLGPCWCVPHRVGCFATYAGMAPRRSEVFMNRAPLERAASSFGLWGLEYLAVPPDPKAVSMVGLSPPIDVAAHEPALPAALVRVPNRGRAYLAGSLRSGTEGEALAFALSGTMTEEVSLVEAEVPAGYQAPKGDVQFAKDAPGEVVLEVRATGPGLVVLNDVFAKGWSATLDGRPVEIVAVNYLARGVWVEGGVSRVTFSYGTPGWGAGWALFWIGGVVLAGWALVRCLPALYARSRREKARTAAISATTQ